MAMTIYNWNISPNREWFVRLVDDGAGITVELYLTSADAAAQTDRQAAGTSDGYGEALSIMLANDDGASEPVSAYQADYAWHIQVSGQAGDAATIYRIKEFVELPEISHAIYRTESLIEQRATAEINEHTHVRITHAASLAVHYPNTDVGDIVQITSDSRSVFALGQVDRLTINGYVAGDGTAALVNALDVHVFEDMQR